MPQTCTSWPLQLRVPGVHEGPDAVDPPLLVVDMLPVDDAPPCPDDVDDAFPLLPPPQPAPAHTAQPKSAATTKEARCELISRSLQRHGDEVGEMKAPLSLLGHSGVKRARATRRVSA
jgi:hypothetical protein